MKGNSCRYGIAICCSLCMIFAVDFPNFPRFSPIFAVHGGRQFTTCTAFFPIFAVAVVICNLPQCIELGCSSACDDISLPVQVAMPPRELEYCVMVTVLLSEQSLRSRPDPVVICPSHHCTSRFNSDKGR